METLLFPVLLRSNTSGLQDLTILKVLHIAITLLTSQFLGTVPCHGNFKIYDLLRPLDFLLLKFISSLNLVVQPNFCSLCVLYLSFVSINYVHT